MATVTVYSKCPNNITYSLFETSVIQDNMTGAKKTQTKVIRSIVINGLHHQKYKSSILTFPKLATTEVDKDLWEKILISKATNVHGTVMKDEKGNLIFGDQLLANKQIFTAKNQTEAEAQLIDIDRGIYDLYTRKDLQELSLRQADKSDDMGMLLPNQKEARKIARRNPQRMTWSPFAPAESR